MKQNTMIHRSARAAIKLLLAALLPATAQSAWAWQGQGTQTSPYQISSIEDLDQLAANVNSGTGDAYAASGYDGKYFVLTKDIDYSHKGDGEEGADIETNYEAIGYASGHPFKGHFDGQGHTVSGIRIYKSGDQRTDKYQGLFGSIVGESSEVKNVTLADARITGHVNTGGIMGENFGGTIRNCHVLSDVIIHAVQVQATCHGGIVGSSYGLVEGCTSAARITTTGTNNNNKFGGIVGGNFYMQGSTTAINHCLYIGDTVEGAWDVGAIAGFNGGEITNSYFCSDTFTGWDHDVMELTNANSAVGYNDTSSHTGYGTSTNVGRAYSATASEGVILSIAGNPNQQYTPNGLKIYAGGYAYNDSFYYINNGNSVTITLSHAERPGYMFGGYQSSDVTLNNDGTFTMPAKTVTVTTTWYDLAPFGYNDDPLVDGSADHPYIISNADGWDLFCDALQDNGKGIFTGKTVRLADDISVTRMAGGANHDFCGTFDGHGHTLTFNYGEADKYSTESYIAPFRIAENCIIENLHVAGDIYTSGQFAAGIVCSQYGTVTIRNCRSSVIIRSSVSGDGTHGGFVAVNNSGTLTIEGCVFDGKILTTGATATTHCGGFVGLRTNTVTISNSLYAPAALEEGETWVGTTGSATFARNGATITNCYYTRTLGTAQGKQAHSITAGEGVSIAFSGTATEYTVSGITAYKDDETQLPGLKYGDVLYAGNDVDVSLTLSTAGEAPAGYCYDGYTAGSVTLAYVFEIDGYTLTMPDEDVTISNVLHSKPVNVSYLDENGVTKTILAIPLDGSETANGYECMYLSGGAYYVGSDITYDDRIEFTNGGDVILILGDGATMTVNRSYNDGRCAIYAYHSLTICGQTLGTGKLNANDHSGIGVGHEDGDLTINGVTVTATGQTGNGIDVNNNLTINDATVTANGNYAGIFTAFGNITINGGNVTATGEIMEGITVFFRGNVTINGGNVSANGRTYGIWTKGNVTINGGNVTVTSENGVGIGVKDGSKITLGWTNASDRITVSSYEAIDDYNSGNHVATDGTVVFNGLFTDGSGNIYGGTLTHEAVDALAGKHLYPYIATLDLAANKAPDQNYWTTFYCGHTDYQINPDENACAYTATYADGKLTLHRLGKEVPKATAVIIVADNNEVSMYADFLNAFTGSNDLRGVDVDTDVADIRNSLGNGTLYVLGMTTVNNEQHFGFHHYTATEMPARKAFVHVAAAPGSNANALTRGISIEFGDDATGIEAVEVLGNPSDQGRANDNSWYTINGVKLNGKPSKSGLYIYKGKKQVVK